MDGNPATQASASSGRQQQAATQQPAAPKPPACTLVIFGAAGDLTKRLLMPALYNMSTDGMLPDDFKVIGVDHGEGDDNSWKQSLTEAIHGDAKDKQAESYTGPIDAAAWDRIATGMRYLRGDFDDEKTFQEVGQAIGQRSAIFYLAVAARFFGPVVEGMGKAGALKQSGNFRRVVIEKPFGADLDSAKALNARILKQADESQFYRIDHFLGKETVQSIMAMRFANGMFEPTWRREYIDHVQITAAETVGVELRGGFYEGTGALRDMVPNHLFTLLSMVAMEPPNSFAAEDVRSEKAKLVDAIRPIPAQDAVRGQYAAGQELGKDVPAYRHEPQVASDSTTETYTALKVRIENWRWAGVPFYLRTGKRLIERWTEIVIHYKPAPYRMFRDTPVDTLGHNVTRLLIDPEQGIETEFDAKVPGPQMLLGRVDTSLRYKDFFGQRPNVGYESLLYDCMMGDATLFQRADAIEGSWKAVQPVLDAWKGNGTGLEFYPAGSDGPAGADALLARDGRAWRKLKTAE
jgi:glucose-6-phosphate 1-dehydrogenase